jgi:hypothetical protein
VDRTEECADVLVEFAWQNGLGPWAAAGKIWQRWVRFGRGEVEGSLAQMQLERRSARPVEKEEDATAPIITTLDADRMAGSRVTRLLV